MRRPPSSTQGRSSAASDVYKRQEYEANLFAAQISLSDEDFLELAERGCDTQQIARTLNSDINLVALKADTLISQGYRLRQQEHCNDFLRYDK